MTSLAPTPKYDLKEAISKNRLRGMWRLMNGYHWKYTLAVLSLGIAALSKTATYLLLRYYADRILGESDGGLLSGETLYLLPIIALGFIGLALFEGLFTFTSGRLAAQTAEGVVFRLRNYLFDHIQRLSFSYHDKKPTGDLVQRCSSDVDALRRFYADQAIGVGRIAILFTVNLIAIMRLSVPLALFSVITVPLIVFTSIFFFKKVTKAYEAYQEQDAVLATTLQENLTGVRVVKAFARQEFEKANFDRDNQEKYRRGRRLLIMHSGFWPVSDIIAGTQMLAGYTLAAIMAINGSITAGTYIAYAGLVVWLIWPMRNLGRLIVQTSTGLVSYNRVLEIIQENREPVEEGSYLPVDVIRGEIEFDRVNFEYEKNSPVLHNISFQSKAGDVIALLGPTGSGKTSLVNLLPRFYEYTSGSITLDGIELNRYSRQFLRSQIGIVEQEPFLFSRTIRENITYSMQRHVTQGEILAAAQAAAIHDVIMSFPHGYDTILGEKGVTLSGGQKQRIAIARTLLKDPRILILDDSTSSVDTETEAEIRNALKRLMHNRTSFVIAHRIQSLMNANLILVLDEGRIIQCGTHEDLSSIDGIYKRIFEIQTRIDSEVEQEITNATQVSTGQRTV